MNNNSDASSPNAENTASTTPTLARTMGLGALIIYGVGDMLGAGVYGLIGETAREMGNAVWLAFIASMVAALLTGLSYASLGSRYPRAGGVAYITHRAFHRPMLSYVIGLAVVISGLMSFATGARAFAGYLWGFLNRNTVALPDFPLWIIPAYVLVLMLINFRGIKESTWMNALCTTIELLGLAIIIFIGFRYWGNVNLLEAPPVETVTNGVTSTQPGSVSLGLALQGAVLTIFAFLGFEDLMNVSEEVKDPQRNFPRGLITALLIAASIYIAISITVVSVVPWQTLAKSDQPLVEVVKTAAPAFPSWLFSLIALFAIANTGLLNYIMGSRLMYGMARQGLVPKLFGELHPKRRTPHWGIVILGFFVAVLACSMDVGPLAKATSTLLLFVFIIVNFALIVLQRRPNEPKGSFEIPSIIPLAGIVVCAAILWNVAPSTSAKIHPYLRDPRIVSAALLAGIVLLYLIARPRNISEETLSEAYEAH